MQRDAADAVGFERAHQLVGAVLGPREDQHLLPAVLADEVGEELRLLVAVHRMDALRDRIDRRIARRHVDLTRLVEQLFGEEADLVGERRGEQQVLPLLRQQRKHALDVGNEPHVEHAVGLVEHEGLDARKVDVALLLMVEQAARRGDEDVDAALQLRDLRAEAHAAEQRERRDLEMAAVRLDRLLRPARRAHASA